MFQYNQNIVRKIKILLIGLGHMGNIHSRVISQNPATVLAGVVEPSNNRFSESLKNVKVFKNINDINFEIDAFDAAIISSNTGTHFDIANKLLSLGIPILIEKPMVKVSSELTKLINYSLKRNIPLRCGLLEIYNPIFTYINELKLKNILSINIYRHSQPIINKKLDSIATDLTIHDISVLNYIFPNSDLKIKSFNKKTIKNEVEMVNFIANLGKLHLNISTNRLSHVKLRKWSILTMDKQYEIDLTNKVIDIYDSGKIENKGSEIIVSKSNHQKVSFVNSKEAAAIQLDAFVQNIQINKTDVKHIDLIRKTHNQVFKLEKMLTR